MSLIIDRLIAHHLHVPFRFGFHHARHRRKLADHLVVEVRSTTGLSGFGEVLPRDYLTGETLASSLDDLAKLWWPLLQGLQLPDENAPFAALDPLYQLADELRRTASYAGIDVAVFDLWARARQQPLAALFGGAPASLDVSAPIGIGMPMSLVAGAARLGGFKCFKVKIGDRHSLERVKAVARMSASHPLVLDANGQGTVEEILDLASKLAAAGIAVASWEQPLAIDQISGQARLAKAGLNLMADESLITRADAAALMAQGSVRQWNLRLAKNGGFSGLKALAQLGASQGIDVQLGALVGETSCLGAASFAAAALIKQVTGRLPLRCESSFPQWLLQRDPFVGGPSVSWGALCARSNTCGGLGVEPAHMAAAARQRFTWSVD